MAHSMTQCIMSTLLMAGLAHGAAEDRSEHVIDWWHPDAAHPKREYRALVLGSRASMRCKAFHAALEGVMKKHIDEVLNRRKFPYTDKYLEFCGKDNIALLPSSTTKLKIFMVPAMRDANHMIGMDFHCEISGEDYLIMEDHSDPETVRREVCDNTLEEAGLSVKLKYRVKFGKNVLKVPRARRKAVINMFKKGFKRKIAEKLEQHLRSRVDGDAYSDRRQRRASNPDTTDCPRTLEHLALAVVAKSPNLVCKTVENILALAEEHNIVPNDPEKPLEEFTLDAARELVWLYEEKAAAAAFPPDEQPSSSDSSGDHQQDHSQDS